MMKYGEWPTMSFWSVPTVSAVPCLWSPPPPKVLRALSQPEWTSPTGTHLFAFPSSSVGFSFKLFSQPPLLLDFLLCCVSLFRQFPFCFHIFTHGHASAHVCAPAAFPP